MNFFNSVFLIVSSLLLLAESKSLDECPNDSNIGALLGSAWVDVPAQEHTSQVRRIRLPQTGLYDEVISCFMATDTSRDDSGGEVEITDGGLNHRYVEVRLNSQIGKALDYVILAYAKEKTN